MLTPGPSLDWTAASSAAMDILFYNWLLENIGSGRPFPTRGLGRHEWFWLDNRRNQLDTKKWQKDGFAIVFRDSRKAVYTKMVWGGRDHPFSLDET